MATLKLSNCHMEPIKIPSCRIENSYFWVWRSKVQEERNCLKGEIRRGLGDPTEFIVLLTPVVPPGAVESCFLLASSGLGRVDLGREGI